jgi:anaerobic selenocysteine-containing dehydrogenase
MPETAVKTTCTRDCPNSCGLLAKVSDGRIVSLSGDPGHPINRGRSCRKCPGFLKRVYDPDRALYPLRKKNGSFQRISWGEALGEIAEKLSAAREKDPRSILYYQGFGARTALKLVNRRFFNLLGPVAVTKGTICGGAGQASQDLDFGNRISHSVLDHGHSQTMILWGRNPAVSSLNLLPVMKELKDSGREVVLIDPVHSQSARLSTRHIAPKAGTDASLALGASLAIHQEGGECRPFLEGRCLGYEGYLKMLRSRSLSQYSQECQVPEREIRDLARLIMERKPVSFVLGWGLHRWQKAHVTIRAIDALGAVAGSIGLSGGGVSQGFEEYQPYDWSVWGDHLNPGQPKIFMPLLGEELERAEPKIEWAMITAGNPAAMLPDSNRVIKSLSALPFLAVAGHFLDDTAKLAHIFLPATTFLEEKDVNASYGHSFIGPLNQAIEPLGEARSDFDLFMELGRIFGLGPSYVKSREEWLSLILAPTIKMGVSLERIFQGGAFQPDIPRVPYRDGIFPTPSGKFQLIQEYEPPAAHQEQHPYQLMSVAPAEWLCSEIRPSDHPPEIAVGLNLQEGQRLGLGDGEMVELWNDLGAITARLRLREELRPDLAVVPRGAWGPMNVNVLTKAVVTDVGQGTAYYESRVSLRKLGRES